MRIGIALGITGSIYTILRSTEPNFVTIIYDNIEEIYYKFKEVIQDKYYDYKQSAKINHYLLYNLHLKAWNSSNDKAKKQSLESFKNVEKLFQDLMLTEDDLYDTIDYVKNSIPIIHFGGRSNTESRYSVHWLKTENKLKNRFQLYNNMHGYYRDRERWESNLFDKHYDRCNIKLKVKYGCLNLMMQNQGCESAFYYGRSYMILKSDVKSRMTFIAGDSDQMNSHICTFDNFIHIFLHLDTTTILDLVKMARYKKNKLLKKPFVNSYYQYIETHIHGDILINRDIEHIMLYHTHAYPGILRRLNNHRIPYTIFS